MSGAWAEMGMAGTPQTLDPGAERHRPWGRGQGLAKGGVRVPSRRGADRRWEKGQLSTPEAWLGCLLLAFLFGLVGQLGGGHPEDTYISHGPAPREWVTLAMGSC